MSDYKKYYISLPDRSNVRNVCSGTYKRFNDNETDAGMMINQDWGYFVKDLELALRSDYDISDDYANQLSQELRTDFIADENRMIPNDRELTNWLKKILWC